MPLEVNGLPRAPFANRLRGPLRARGFVRDGRVYRKEGLTFMASGQWYVLSEEAAESGAWPLSVALGHPGFWKRVHNGTPLHRVFEIPAWVVSDQPEEDRWDHSGPAPFAKLLDWALNTRAGRVPSGWQQPDANLVQSWIPRGALTVQAKGHVRQGELILRPDRWALRVPILPRWAQDLPEPRRRAIEDLLDETQRHWAMIRMGVPMDASSPALVAEVDFTGAPHSELLFSAGLDVLRHVVAWLAETVAVLGDPSVAITGLAPVGSHNTNSAERKTA